VKELEVILNIPETVPLDVGELKENISWTLIKPYSFPIRLPNWQLPNGKTKKENEIFNEQRCKKLNKK